MSMNLTKRCTSRILDAKGYLQKLLPLSLVINGDLSNGTEGWLVSSGTISAASNELSFLTTSTGNQVYKTLVPATIVGHKYYGRALVQASSTLVGVRVGTSTPAYHSGNSQYQLLSVVFTATGTAHSINIIDNRTSGFDTIKIKQALAIDLTATYGSGNEPTTAWCDLNIPFRTEIGSPERFLIDRSALRNNGTFSNVTWVQLPSGVWVMNFNGADSYVEIADLPSMRMTTGGTICAWIYARTIGETEGRIIDKSSAGGGENGYIFTFASGNKVYFRTNLGTYTITSDNTVPYSTWKFVVATFNSSGRKIYVNATDVTANGGSETALPPNVSGVVRIGNRAGATDRTFDGYIALPKIYSKMLSATEIARLFNSQRGFFGV